MTVQLPLVVLWSGIGVRARRGRPSAWPSAYPPLRSAPGPKRSALIRWPLRCPVLVPAPRLQFGSESQNALRTFDSDTIAFVNFRPPPPLKYWLFVVGLLAGSCVSLHLAEQLQSGSSDPMFLEFLFFLFSRKHSTAMSFVLSQSALILGVLVFRRLTFCSSWFQAERHMCRAQGALRNLT